MAYAFTCFLKRFLVCGLIFLIYSYAFSILDSHTLNIIPDISPEKQDQDLKKADQEWQKVYGDMSDQEKMNGIVLEPVFNK